jgi:hypothetical protein
MAKLPHVQDLKRWLEAQPHTTPPLAMVSSELGVLVLNALRELAEKQPFRLYNFKSNLTRFMHARGLHVEFKDYFDIYLIIDRARDDTLRRRLWVIPRPGCELGAAAERAIMTMAGFPPDDAGHVIGTERAEGAIAVWQRIDGVPGWRPHYGH